MGLFLFCILIFVANVSSAKLAVTISPSPHNKQQNACLKVIESYISNYTDLSSECEALKAAYNDGCAPYLSVTDDDVYSSSTSHIHLIHKKKIDPTSNSDCCNRIIDTYNQRCNDKDNGELTDQRLIATVTFLIFGLFSRSFVRTRNVSWLPEAAVCILCGMVGGLILNIGIPGFLFSFDERLFLRVLLPPICFEASLSINKNEFRRLIGPILTFAIVGTILSTLLTGMFVRYLSTAGISNIELPWAESLAFGALISSIDPVATLAILNNLGLPSSTTLYVVIFGESLLNDGVAVVLFDTICTFMKADPTLNMTDGINAILTFLAVFIGSTIVGFLAGLSCNFYFRFMHGSHRPLVEVALFFLWALLPYYVCDSFGGSGIVAIVVCGVVIDIYARRHLCAISRTNVNFVVEVLSVVMETAIFCYVGVFVFITDYHWNFFLCFSALLSCLAARLLMVLLLSFFVNHFSFCKCSWRLYRKRKRGGGVGVGGGDNGSNDNLSQSFLSDASDGSFMSNEGDEQDQEQEPDDAGGGGRESFRIKSKALKHNGEIGNSDAFISGKTQFVLWFSGLRGAMSFALVENLVQYDSILDEGTYHKKELRAMVATCVFVTIFLFGGSTNWVLRKLNIGNKGNGNNGNSGNHLSTRGSFRNYTSGPANDLSLANIADDIGLSLEDDTDISLLDNTVLLSDDGLYATPLKEKQLTRLKTDHF